MRFQGQTILVTGASEGIGFAVAQGLAGEGAHVVMIARRPDVLGRSVASIREAGGSCEGTVLDVSDHDALAGFIAELGRRPGRLDGLVNNAFTSIQKDIASTTLEDWRAVFAVNVEAAFVAIQAVLPIMQAQGGGAIVNIASVSGVRARPNSAAYSSSKAALIHLGAIAAIEAAPHKIRVNTIIPGATTTPSFQRAFASMPPQDLKALGEGQVPLGRFANAQDVAKGVLFMLSDEAGFVTGAELRVEGGAFWTR